MGDALIPHADKHAVIREAVFEMADSSSPLRTQLVKMAMGGKSGWADEIVQGMIGSLSDQAELDHTSIALIDAMIPYLGHEEGRTQKRALRKLTTASHYYFKCGFQNPEDDED